MSENLGAGIDFPKQSPDMDMLIARGRALRNKMICDSFSTLIKRIRRSVGK